MRVEIRGMERLKRKVGVLPSILDQAMFDATAEISELIQSAAELRLASSIKYASGELLGSLKHEVVINAQGKIVGRVWSDKEHAVYRELGTGPVGEASPKDLPEGVTPVYTQTAWFIPVNKVAVDLEEIYGIPKVEIQGTNFYITKGQPARPFLYPSFKDLIDDAPSIYQKHVMKGLRELK